MIFWLVSHWLFFNWQWFILIKPKLFIFLPPILNNRLIDMDVPHNIKKCWDYFQDCSTPCFQVPTVQLLILQQNYYVQIRVIQKDLIHTLISVTLHPTLTTVPAKSLANRGKSAIGLEVIRNLQSIAFTAAAFTRTKTWSLSVFGSKWGFVGKLGSKWV